MLTLSLFLCFSEVIFLLSFGILSLFKLPFLWAYQSNMRNSRLSFEFRYSDTKYGYCKKSLCKHRPF
jgi:hypothetical protein